MRLQARGAAVDWLIAGLGNPGREYDRTRHNIGFAVLDELAVRWGASRSKDRFHAKIAEGKASIGGEPAGVPPRGPRVLLVWPMTYMNDAGKALGPARGSLRLPRSRVLIVHDEIDLPFGELRSRLGGGLAGHNGLKSASRELGGGDFWRVRVGVGRPASTDPDVVSNYVLSKFSEPQSQVRELIVRAGDAVEDLLREEVAIGEARDFQQSSDSQG